MALNGNNLGDAIRQAVDALSDADKANRTKTFRAMGSAIVDYLKANAVVHVAATVPAAIPVQVVPATGTGATTAPSTATDNAGTIT